MIGRGRRLAACLGLAALVLAACGKKGPPVAPEMRAPLPIADLTGAVHASAIELAWTPPNRRVDHTRLRDLAQTRIFRLEDGGGAEPKSAMLVDGRIVGYREIASIRADEPAPVVARGNRLVFTDRQALAYGRRYTYVVIAGDSQGRVGPPATRVSVSYVPAAEPPVNLVATPGERTVRLRWEAPARLLDGSAPTEALAYEVLRAPAADAELTPVTRVPVAERALTDADLENDRTYYYAVRAVRVVAGTTAYSDPSPRVAVTPRDMTPPSPPANLVGIASEATVRLSWSPSPERDVAGYVVYRAPEGGAFERIGSTTAPSTTFVDRGVTRGAFRYAVTAQDSAARPNESRRSNEVRVSVP
ncbi:MAG: hypothetical protein DMD96_10115 [Candidatus Rokuibacteriota bacterium]|nr:MAG: hypothetical protein DMD96_10115 [Candidatus Rokubacteria bacterium]